MSVEWKVASESYAFRYARVLLAMSLDEAKRTLGFSPGYNPTPDEIKKNWRQKSLENHPDRGGTTEKMVEVNVAKDILEGKARPSAPGGGGARSNPARNPPQERGPSQTYTRREPPKVVKSYPGVSFDDALGNAGFPARSITWTFVSKYVFGTGFEDEKYPRAASFYLLYGTTEAKHYFVGVMHREAYEVLDSDLGGIVSYGEKWEFSHEEVLANKAGVKESKIKGAIKIALTVFKGGGKATKVPTRFVAWEGGMLTESNFKKNTKGTGGLSLKEMLANVGLVGAPAAGGGKSVKIEFLLLENKEKRQKVMEDRRKGIRHQGWQAYDNVLRVNGKNYVLSNETVAKLESQTFFGWIVPPDLGQGIAKNLTGLRPRSRMSPDTDAALSILLKCFVGEPSALESAVRKGIEEAAPST